MLQYKVKAGRLSNLTDARFFNAQGVDWLGFSMDVLDENSISLKDLKEIRQWLFEPKIVLECGPHQDRGEMIYLANEIHAEAVHVGLDHPILQEDHFIYPIMVTVGFDDLQHVRLRRALEKQENIEALIVQQPEAGFDWKTFSDHPAGRRRAIEGWRRKYDVLIDLPFEADWLLQALELFNPTGIHLSGTREEKPGLSRVDYYAGLLELLEVDENT